MTYRRWGLMSIPALVVVASASFVHGYSLLGHSWSTTSVPYYVNPQSQYVSANAVVSAVQTAAASWRQQTRANIELVYAGTTNGSSLLLNGKSEVMFRNASNGGLVGETYNWWDANGRLIEADIVLYEGTYKFFTGSGCTQGIYVEDIAIHEFGHFLGLSHTGVAGATMAPTMPTYCDRTWLTLEGDDIAGLEKLYGSGSGGSPSNTAPTLSISSPGSNSSYGEGTAITFAASATDALDGVLSGSIGWASNISGNIGTGSSFTRSLPAGNHVITAAVTDSGGLTGQAQITIAVTAASPSGGASLTARGYKVKGRQYAELSWSGLASGAIDVYRNGTHVATVPTGSGTTDAINQKGGGSYAYRVCNSGTSTCSNTAGISF